MSCTSACPRIPTAISVAHCSACHETFSTAGNFDKHRRGGKCLLPDAGIGMVKRDGIWRKPRDERQVGRIAAWAEGRR